ncbi:nitrilase-related carbon-nitrogen hydrolase [Yinghuangia seranimata]|uniref:nitrilase-related carbon-nitrogen hydrolase n=1 Tax=Yinghuangia seranimata TaxID=408067 RepID=UPI00248BF161|nr:nitrilase-related carbon-nitrogen hydrolase [Yinghuangia seranimata]MDI2129939.1 nitrilase-related carbon-nitrogen hydrolase [Yinghuangia seranimata]
MSTLPVHAVESVLESPPSPRRGGPLVVALGAALASAVLFRLGTGLDPAAWLTWLAPLPVLVAAPRVGAAAAGGAAFAAWLGGESGMWSYYRGEDQLDMPLPAVLAVFLGTALVFAGVVLLVRRLLRLRRFALAAVALPAAWAAVEYLASLVTPHGAFWSLAYSQADVLPVLQTASATGPWGVTFLVLAVPAAAATCLAPDVTNRVRITASVAAAALLATALGYGAWRLDASAGSAERVRVALVSTSRDRDPIPVDTPEGRDLLAGYLAEARQAAERGARFVVLPENTFEADDRTMPMLSGPFAALATERRVDVVVGVRLGSGATTYNTAWDFPAAGGAPSVYRKHHMVPGLEDDFTPGEGLAFVPGTGTRYGVIICKDLDFPDLVREFGREGTRFLLAPAWDFDSDAWLHSRMAATRGVENGLTVARSARRGALTVSDPYGRVSAERRTGGSGQFTSLVADAALPHNRTLYTRFGDWFAWLSTALLLAALVGAVPGVRRSGSGRGRSAQGRSGQDRRRTSNV